MHMAAELAALLRTNIQALYIEDNNILTVVDLPFTREVSIHTAEINTIDSNLLIQKFRAEAESIKQQINEIAVTRRVSINFSSMRGQKMHVIKDSTQEVEVVLIPAVTKTHGRKQRHPLMNKVVMVFDEIDASHDKALSIALSYAEKKGYQLYIIVNSDLSKQHFEEKISEQDRRAEYDVVDFSNMDEVVSLLYKYPQGMFVLPQSSCLIEDERLLQQLINQLESDILIVR
jgi:hypothetical protein